MKASPPWTWTVGSIEVRSSQDATYAEQSQRLKARIAKIQEQLASCKQSIQIYERRLKSKRVLQKEGLVCPIETDEAREALE